MIKIKATGKKEKLKSKRRENNKKMIKILLFVNNTLSKLRRYAKFFMAVW